jgi:EF hand
MPYFLHSILATLVLPTVVLANGVETIIGHPPGSAHSRQSTVAPGGRFKQLDANRDGRISRREMEQGNQARLQAFERADSNADGQLSPDEWRAYKGGKKKRKSAAL